MNTDPAPLEPTLMSFRHQVGIFSVLNLFVIAAFLLAHVLLAPYWGALSLVLLIALGTGFLFHAFILTWIQSKPISITPKLVLLVTIASIAINTGLTFVAAITNHEHSQYFALMIVPVLEGAFRFSFLGTLLVVAMADLVSLFWVWEYYRVHASRGFTEYLEVGTVSFIYTVVGIVVWLLVKHLQRNEAHLIRNLAELQKIRQQLSEEEKLAAVGRLSSAIAHEIRNPVAMISSSLSLAAQNDLAEPKRQEMFDIAGKEAVRLEKLTADFLAYARPQPLTKTFTSAADTLLYVASACRAYALEKGVRLTVEASPELSIDMDAAKIQQALMNLVKNAIEASAPEQSVALNGLFANNGVVGLEVHNAGPAIPKDVLKGIFEPFFTTKQDGTGLGLAIARNIARAHGGNLVLRVNEPGRVCFALELPATIATNKIESEKKWAAS